MNIANFLTLARIAFIPLFIYLLLTGKPNLSVVVFLAIALTDYLDGYLARKLDQVTDLGKLLDPLADKILVLCALIALTGMGKISPIPVMLILVRELGVSGIRTAAAASGKIIAASTLGKVKTVSQMLAIAWLILSWPYADLVLWIAVLITLISGAEFLWKNRKLDQLK